MTTTTTDSASPIERQMREVGERLRVARELFRISSLRRFATYLGQIGYSVDWTSIQRWEVGHTRIPADYVLIVAQATRTNPTWLLTGEGEREW